MSSIHGVNVGGTLYDVTDSSNVAPLESTNFASRNYAKGRCLIMMDGLLYEAMSAITSGDALVVNTNVKRTTLDELVANLGTSNALIAPTEDGVTSSDDYAIGAQIARSGLLYNVIDTIAEGDAFVVGTNIALAGSVTEQLTINKNAIDNEIATRAKLGAHNLLRPAFFSTTTISGVTYTSNNDGTYVLNGISTGDPAFINLFEDVTLDSIGITDLDSDYTLSKGIDDTLNYGVQIAFYLNGIQTGRVQSRANGPITFNFRTYSFDTVTISLVVAKTVSLNNAVLKPMLRLATDPYTEYTPYVPTNAELLPKVIYNNFGVKNVCKNVLSSQTTSGVTVTVNDDGSVDVTTGSGTATANVILYLNGSSTKDQKLDGTYILSGCPNGGGNTKYGLQLNATGLLTVNLYDDSEVTLNLTPSNPFYVAIVVYNGASIPTPITFKPMLRLASELDPTYQPYAMTNRKLTDIIETHTLVDSVTASVNNANTWENTGISFTLTERALIQVLDSAINSGVLGVAVSNSNSSLGGSLICEDSNITGKQLVGVLNAGTYYVWAKHATANVNNTFIVRKLMTV